MEGEIVPLRRNAGEIKAIKKIKILVVDDDATCLSVVAAKLKKFHYQVATAKHPNDALVALRIKHNAFDLVVTDVHMPGMNGIQLQQVIAREFNLPVVLMSADGKEDIVLRGLESGAEFFMRKPISSDDIMDLWQHSCKKKLNNKVVIEEMDEKIVQGRAPFNMNSFREVNVDNISKRISPRKDGSRGNCGERFQMASRKKKKVTWTHSLHNRFLEAIRTIGFDRAAPKNILERMNVPGLTRENVASHLQKYRIFLKRVYGEATIGMKQSFDDQKSFSMTLAPRFRPSSSSAKPSTSIMLHNDFTSLHNQDHQHSTGVYFPYHESSSSNLVTSGVNCEVPSWITGINPVFDFSMPVSSNVTHQSNYAGLDNSNVQLFFESKQSFNRVIDFPRDLELQTNNVEVVSTPNNNDISVGNLDWQSTSSSNIGFGTSSGGGNVCDVIKECHMLCSNAIEIENVDSIDKHQNSANNAPLDLDELLKLPIDESNLNIGFDGQNHIQNAGENIMNFNFRGSTSGWDNHISSFDQDLNELIDQDDFLKSLFDPALFEVDGKLEECK